MTYNDFIARTFSKMVKQGPLRTGQLLMNDLYDARPDLWVKIHGTANDCFYLDSVVGDTLQYLADNW